MKNFLLAVVVITTAIIADIIPSSCNNNPDRGRTDIAQPATIIVKHVKLPNGNHCYETQDVGRTGYFYTCVADSLTDPAQVTTWQTSIRDPSQFTSSGVTQYPDDTILVSTLNANLRTSLGYQ